MSDRPGMSRIIKGDAQTVYERYELPNVKSRQQKDNEQGGLVTAAQLEALQKQAYDEGFKQGQDDGHQNGLELGREEGHKQGLLEGQEEVQQILKRFEQIIKFLTEPVEQVNLQVEEELLQLAMATAKQIIRREIHADPGQIIAVIKEGIAALPSGASKIKVFLHPADAEIARDNLKLAAQQNSANNSASYSTNNSTNNSTSYNEKNNDHDEPVWRVIEEPVLTRGGCRIESESSRIDASIETRVAEIAAQIMGSERAASRQEPGDEDEADQEAEQKAEHKAES